MWILQFICITIQESNRPLFCFYCNFLQISAIHIVPATLKTLLRIPVERPSIMTHLKAVLSSGAPTPANLEKEFRTKFDGVIFQRCMFKNISLHNMLIITQVDSSLFIYVAQIVNENKHNRILMFHPMPCAIMC